MQCPKCNAVETSVVDSRSTGQTNRRRRQCAACGYRFTTREITDEELQDLLNIRSSIAFLHQQAQKENSQ